MLSQLGAWGPQAEVLKVGAPNMGFKPFTPQGEAGSWEHPPDCMFCARAGVYDDSVSQLSLPILM